MPVSVRNKNKCSGREEERLRQQEVGRHGWTPAPPPHSLTIPLSVSVSIGLLQLLATDNNKMCDVEHCYSVVLEIVKSAGTVLAEGFKKTKKVTTKTSSSDLVTEYDKRIESLIIDEILKTFPTHKFIGEETASAEGLTNDPTWMIDPIDGTNNFVHGDENCVISIALAVNQVLEIGIVYSPIKDQLFSAKKGNGSWLNGKPIHVSDVTDIKQSLLGFEVSLAGIPKIKETVLKRLAAIVSQAHGVRAIGTCALSLCYVAQGAWDAYQVDYLYCWDYAAGALIVQEAGGTVISTDGSPFEIMKRRIIAASSKQLADQLVTVLKQADSNLI
ncbi:inositol monophosphatase 1-like [Homalodisca vitripennis]|uniref:inositol monophosphatase 1-like n=2 Tax=Homalodisca vitripennis TaxID=197043 RepID=UPI001EEAC408|nr:inositol monophosphatase 1-like [Homalodisca vitripennis]